MSSDGRFQIGRTYRSFPGGANTSLRQLPLGLAVGWQFNFEMELHLGTFSGSPSSPTGNVTLLTPDGTAYDFVLDSSGQFLPRAASGQVSHDYEVEIVSTLPSNLATIYDSQTEWKITGPDDRVWTLQTFSNYNVNPPKHYFGRPTEITERDGYAWTLTYAADGGLSTIVDTFGRTANFTWNYFYVTFLSGISGSLPFPEAVDTITFQDGTSVEYSYDPSPSSTPPSTSRIQNLTGVTLRDASLAVADSTTYHYENTDFRHAVTGITDHRGVRIATYEYNDDYGRATLETGADGQDQVTVAYGTSGSLETRTVTNPLGRVSVYKFEKIGGSSPALRLVGVDGEVSSHCPATATVVTYGVDGFISSTTDEEGRVTSYTRDARGRPTEVVLADGLPEEQQIDITWDSTYNVPTTIERPGLTTTRVYNGSGQLTSLTETDTTTHSVPYSTNGQTRTWAYTYTTGGLVATVDGPLPGAGDTVSYTYDAAGYVKTYTDEVGHTTTVNGRNNRGQPTTITDPNGLISSIGYDARGFVTSMIADPGGIAAATSFTYDGAGNITRMKQPNGAFLDMSYDASNRIVTVKDSFAAMAAYSYDAMGNVTKVEISDVEGDLFFRWNQTFDELGRLLTLTSVPGETWSFGYDKVDNLTSAADPNNRPVGYGYDALNRLISFTDERSDTTVWAYDAQDEPSSTTDPRTVVTGYVRNGWGEAIQEQSNDIGAIVYERDQNGDVTERTDARGVITQYSYDDAGRILTTVYPAQASSNVAYAYDATAGGNKGVGRLTSVTDAAGTVAYSYDLLGRTVSETRSIGARNYVTSYQWDRSGLATRITYPSGRIVELSVANAAVEAMATRASALATRKELTWITRTPFGLKRIINFGNNTAELRFYDLDARINRIQLANGVVGDVNFLDRTYVWGDKRNLTGITDNLDAADSETFGYADNGFLASAAGPYGSISFSHDGVGNRTQRVRGSGPVSTDVYGLGSGSNRLTGITTNGTPSRSFTSDAAGNITVDNDLAGGVTKTFTWNHPGQLASVSIGGVTQGSYVYDYLSRMVARTIPASPITLHRVHDLDGNVIAEYDAGTGTLLTEYVWLEGRPIAVIADAGSPAPSIYWVHTDQIDRPIMMTDSRADGPHVVWRASYLPFGEVHSITGSATLDYRFPGQWFQLESGLAYNWHRHYDATTGRYVQPDPLGMPDGPSRWAYAGNSPLMEIDREGLQSKKKGPTFICVACTAPHGGAFGPYCPDCYTKSLKGDLCIPPLVFKPPALED